jgi:hypothetical protein
VQLQGTVMEYSSNPKSLKEKAVNETWDKLKELLIDDTFKIDTLFYDEIHFGNIVVILTSNEHINIYFLMDRKQYFTCEIGYSAKLQEWYPLEDILQIIGANQLPNFQEFYEMMSYTYRLIKGNWKIIKNLFDENHISETRMKLNDIIEERGKELDKLHPVKRRY